MKETGVIFQGWGVRAIQDGSKTMTRRTKGLAVFNIEPNNYRLVGFNPDDGIAYFEDKRTELRISVKCPYGISGDRIWVRETYWHGLASELMPSGEYETYWGLKTQYLELRSKPGWADDSQREWMVRRPSIHMRRKYSRINLEIVSVRPERVKDITEEEAIKEGVSRDWLENWADELSAKADVDEPYWMHHHAGNDEHTFCYRCGEKRRKELLKKAKPKTCDWDNLQHLDGGFSYETDSCLHCEICGKLLNYTLTDYGIESEWSHFTQYGFDIKSPNEAYHIATIFQGKQGKFDNESRVAFRSIWESINGAGSWENWCWAIEFKRI